MNANVCGDCNAEIDYPLRKGGVCAPCYDRAYSREYSRRFQNAKRAHWIVSAAVLNGHLPNLRDEIVDCVDCGEQATCYDHRDYSKPLDVQPVCHSCNKRRGPGLNREAA
jgi:hypothetical protein